MDANGVKNFFSSIQRLSVVLFKRVHPINRRRYRGGYKRPLSWWIPMVSIHATVYDGSTMRSIHQRWHSHCQIYVMFQRATAKAAPVLQEPIMKVEVTMPEEYMGDVIGDVTLVVDVSRYGRSRQWKDCTCICTVLAEMFSYFIDLVLRHRDVETTSMFFRQI